MWLKIRFNTIVGIDLKTMQVLKSEYEGASKGFVEVQWESSESPNTYRMGAEGGKRDLLSIGPSATAFKSTSEGFKQRAVTIECISY